MAVVVVALVQQARLERPVLAAMVAMGFHPLLLVLLLLAVGAGEALAQQQ
jgi:hypothetical protein